MLLAPNSLVPRWPEPVWESPDRSELRQLLGFREGAAPGGTDLPWAQTPRLASSKLLPKASLCARGTVRPNKLKWEGLEQTRVYCRAELGEGWLVLPKSPELPEGLQQSVF